MTPIVSLLTGFLVTGVIVFCSYKLGFLTFSGGIASTVVGTMVLGLGGLNWAIVLLWFFFSSSILSKIGKKEKDALSSLWVKGDKREAWQVLANGVVASALVIGHKISPEPIWYLLFISTIAAVTADTWGTEIGVLSSSSVLSILNFKKVPKGSSGGITLLGSSASLLGSLSVAILGILSPFAPYEIKPEPIVLLALAGFSASLVDSVAGAAIQSRYFCTVCSDITEKKIHCNQNSSLKSGWKFINNDAVNFLCSLSGSLFGYIFFSCQNFS
ncbi:MAG: putative membrane protein [candidate division Zixibacteria bacterium RBG-1]|nr:MAG: putative membrane protein [candidate division Zixibacteria bacterium RBG-1]